MVKPEILTVAPERWNNPSSFTVTGAKDSDWEWDKGEIQCTLTFASVRVVDNTGSTPVFVRDGDIGSLPTEDSNGNPINSIYVSGDMVAAGVDHEVNIWLSGRGGPKGGVEFSIVVAWNDPGVSAVEYPRHVTVPHGASNIKFDVKTTGTPTMSYIVQVTPRHDDYREVYGTDYAELYNIPSR